MVYLKKDIDKTSGLDLAIGRDGYSLYAGIEQGVVSAYLVSSDKIRETSDFSFWVPKETAFYAYGDSLLEVLDNLTDYYSEALERREMHWYVGNDRVDRLFNNWMFNGNIFVAKPLDFPLVEDKSWISLESRGSGSRITTVGSKTINAVKTMADILTLYF